MAEVRPLRGIRFAPECGRLDTLLSPPYDVTTGAQRRALLDADAHNIVRIDHPAAGNGGPEQGEEGYAGAAALLDQWLDQGILAQDQRPSLYVIEHEFASPWEERTARRIGVLALIAAKPWDEAPIKPHERTFDGPKRDRLSLLRSTRTQTSPIFGLWNRGAEAQALLGEITGRPPQQSAEFRGDIGTEIVRLWRVDDADEMGALNASLADSSLYIADGHHRYETAVAYAEERARSGANGSAAQVLTYLSADDDPGLFLLPTHRIVSTEATSLRTMAELRPRLDDSWQITKAEDRTTRNVQRSEGRNVFVVAAGDGLWQLSRPKAAGSPRSRLDVTILHEELLPALPLHGDAARDGRMTFEHDAERAISAVRDRDAAFAFLMAPPSVAEMMSVADAGETMPQKSTYFYPKVPTGLVLWRVE
jgi:uncharacterized protein (DUF1015 family)